MTLSFGAYKKLSSSKYQALLIFDFNSNTRSFAVEDFKNLVKTRVIKTNNILKSTNQ